jgi:hypothetical protein
MPTTTDTATEVNLGCPRCGSVALETIEQLVGTCASTITRGPDGTVNVEGHGETDIAWDATESIGVQCTSCRWAYEGDDWTAQLTPAAAA